VEAYQLLQRARMAATQLFDDVDIVRFIDTEPTGERRYLVTRKGTDDVVTVTINPNGIKAGVEWRKGREGKSEYRIFRLPDLTQPSAP
jgi:hypothetical protein